VTVSTNAALGTNALLTLNFANSETNTVSALILGGVSKPNGVYNATTDPLYLSGAGSLQVTPSINPLPGPIQFGVSGSTLALSWPTNLGWILQSETNLTSNAWFDVANSGNVTSTNITINPATRRCSSACVILERVNPPHGGSDCSKSLPPQLLR